MNFVSALLVLIVAQLRTAQVYAGPDHTPTALCSDLYHAIKPEHRHLARDSVQALQVGAATGAGVARQRAVCLQCPHAIQPSVVGLTPGVPCLKDTVLGVTEA